MRTMRTNPGNCVSFCYAATDTARIIGCRREIKKTLPPPHNSHLEAKPLHTGVCEGPAVKPNKPDVMCVQRDNALGFLERWGKGERREALQYAVYRLHETSCGVGM